LIINSPICSLVSGGLNVTDTSQDFPGAKVTKFKPAH